MNHIDLKLYRGPLQNNGASPWFAKIPMGSERQVLKFNLDTGVNYNWVTSTLCAPGRCDHYGGLRFDCNKSTSLELKPESEKTVDLGPWGKMAVETGSDELVLPNGAALRTNLYLAKDYVGKNFAELDWDGGLGLPCGMEFLEPDNSLIIQQLIENQILNQDVNSVSAIFDTSQDSPVCRLGSIDDLPVNRQSRVFIEWERYVGAGQKYGFLWSGHLHELRVGTKVIATDIQLCLDTGSSGFKGDPEILSELISQTSVDNKSSIILHAGKTERGDAGMIEVSPDRYRLRIEEGERKSELVPQFFADVPVPKLLLVGSVLLDLMVVEFEYRVDRSDSVITLHPKGMNLYKGDGRNDSAGLEE